MLTHIIIFAAGALGGMVVTCFFAANKVQRLEAEVATLKSDIKRWWIDNKKPQTPR